MTYTPKVRQKKSNFWGAGHYKNSCYRILWRSL